MLPVSNKHVVVLLLIFGVTDFILFNSYRHTVALCFCFIICILFCRLFWWSCSKEILERVITLDPLLLFHPFEWIWRIDIMCKFILVGYFSVNNKCSIWSYHRSIPHNSIDSFHMLISVLQGVCISFDSSFPLCRKHKINWMPR